MIEPRQLEPCKKCQLLLRLGEPDRHTEHLMHVGEPVVYGKHLGSAAITTNHFYQCPECGQLWQEIVDGELGRGTRYLCELKIVR